MTLPLLLGQTGKNLKEKFFVGVNPTFGTAVAINADPAAIAATELMFCVTNNDDADSGKVIVVPSYLKLVTDTVAASGTTFMIQWSIDNTDRYSSGGSALAGKSTFTTQDSTWTTLAPKGVAYFGDITGAAASSAKVVGQSIMAVQTASQIKGNVYLFQWCGNGGSLAGVRSMTAEGFHSDILSPVYLDPQTCLIAQVLEASAATTAAKFHVEFGWYELDNWHAFGA